MKEKQENNKNSFFDLDEIIKKHFTMHFTFMGAFFIVSLIYLIGNKNFPAFLIIVLAELAYFAVLYYKIRLCLDEKVYTIDGTVCEIYEKKKLKGSLGLDRNYILLKQENIYIKIFMDKTKKYREGNVLRVYVEPKKLMPLNEDTYLCNSYIYLTLIKQSE